MSVKFEGMTNEQLASLAEPQWLEWREYLIKKMVTAPDPAQRKGQKRRMNERYRFVKTIRDEKRQR